VTVERLDDVAMREVRLATPVSAADIARLELGDVVYLDGILYTAREGVYRKVVDEGWGLPESVRALTNVTRRRASASASR
jgi:L(+)-tartrate dehydratase beta subunit